MKILFVCKSNFGRSQIAETLFNYKSKKHQAISAGTEKGRVIDHKLIDFPEHSNLFVCMSELGFDIRENKSKLLTKEMIEEVDRVYVMAEKKTWPAFLKESNKVIFWKVEDMAGESLKSFIDARDKINLLIDKLLLEIE